MLRRGVLLTTSKSGSLRQVDAEPISTPLIPARHLCRFITKLLLDVGFVNVSARSQASPQTMPGEQRKAIFLGQLAAYTSDQYSLLYEASNVFIGQACIKRAGLIARPAANLDLAPTSFATQEHHRAIVFYLHPAAAVGGIVLAVVKADKLGPAQATRVADQKNCAIPLAT
jgi:hypothetical protein